MTPRWPLTPLVQVTCVTLPMDHSIQVPWKYVKVCGYSDPFFKNLNQRSLTLHDLWPQFCWGHHVWLYPKIIVSKSHENTSKYVDTLTLFKTLIQRSLTPRWPLTSYLLRSHVWLYPKIIVSKSHGNTSMYVDTVIDFAKLPHTTYIHTTYRMSDHIVSFWTKFRCDKNKKTKTKTPPPKKIHKPIFRTLATCHPRAMLFVLKLS